MKNALYICVCLTFFGMHLPFTESAQAAPYPFSDSFDSGLGNWSAGGQWALIDSTCLDGSFAVTDSPDGNYPNNYNGSLTLATSVDLSSATAPVLIFWHKMWVAYQDYALVEVSTDGGFTWSQLTSWYSEQYLATWTITRLDLAAYVGMQIKIRFRLQASAAYVNDGWYVDKVEIREANDETSLPYPFTDDFENGMDNWLVSGCEWNTVQSDCLGGNSAITDSAGGNYPDSANSIITLAGNIDLASATSPVLIFWHKLWAGYQDYALVELSTDGGVSWTDLTYWYSEAYLSTWTLSRLDLSAYVGEQIKIRFRLRASQAYTGDGWYVDKVEIREATAEAAIAFPFADDFENGLDNWLVSGCEWQAVPSDCLGGNLAITDSVGVNYPDSANSMITLAGNVDLSATTSPVLIFWHKMWTNYQDSAVVEVSNDGGVTWSQLTSWYSEVYLSTWTLSRLDLSAYIGEQIKIRFRLRASQAYVSDGWYVDGVEIREAADEVTLPYPFSDNFENGLSNWLVSGCEWGLVPSDTCAQGTAITDSPAGNYPSSANSMATLAGRIDLTSATFPVLSFWHKFAVDYQDTATVEISTDGGLSWVSQASWYSQQYMNAWGMEQYNLTQYVGMQVNVRFRLRASQDYENDGWHVDSISLGEFDATDGDGIPDAFDNCTSKPNWCQRDTDLDGYGNACDADLNNDCIVNPIDLGQFKAVFFTQDAEADLNGDGEVNPVDLGIFKSLFFQAPGPGANGACGI